jgi:CRISPR/Cas system-associated exonuclease Cas4 (RecB family)
MDTMEQMRGLIEADADPGPQWVSAKCSACGFRETC